MDWRRDVSSHAGLSMLMRPRLNSVRRDRDLHCVLLS